MRRLRGCLLVLLIFGLGLAAGFFFGIVAGSSGVVFKMVKGGPAGVREVIYEQAKVGLGLNYEQKEEVRLILKESSTELDGITASVRPSVEAALDRARGRIRALLTPGQRAKFDRFIDEGWRRWHPQPPTPDSLPDGSASKEPIPGLPPAEPAKVTEPPK